MVHLASIDQVRHLICFIHHVFSADTAQPAEMKSSTLFRQDLAYDISSNLHIPLISSRILLMTLKLHIPLTFLSIISLRSQLKRMIDLLCL
jgi:hypothetical protein